VVVPNSNLVNAQLINWTRSDTHRRVDLPFAVAAGPTPDQVVDVLRSAVAGVPAVLERPKPEVLVNQIGKDTLSFVVQFWIPQERLDETRSEVVKVISTALKSAEYQMV